jgi:hypothetical protein
MLCFFRLLEPLDVQLGGPGTRTERHAKAGDSRFERSTLSSWGLGVHALQVLMQDAADLLDDGRQVLARMVATNNERMTSFSPGHNPPQVTIPARICAGSKKRRLRGPASSKDRPGVGADRGSCTMCSGRRRVSSTVRAIGEGYRASPSSGISMRDLVQRVTRLMAAGAMT